MAIFDNATVALTGTTAVDVIADPGASIYFQADAVMIWNRDTATRTITAQVTGGSITPFEVGSVQVATLKYAAIPLNGLTLKSGQKLQCKSDATAATTEPAVRPSWFKIP